MHKESKVQLDDLVATWWSMCHVLPEVEERTYERFLTYKNV